MRPKTATYPSDALSALARMLRRTVQRRSVLVLHSAVIVMSPMQQTLGNVQSASVICSASSRGSRDKEDSPNQLLQVTLDTQRPEFNQLVNNVDSHMPTLPPQQNLRVVTCQQSNHHNLMLHPTKCSKFLMLSSV